MARIITSRLQHLDPMARGGEQIVTKGGPKFAKRGLFGGDMDIDELNKLNRAIASGMDIAKDVVPTIKGVVDAPMKKIQEMMQQSDIDKVRAKAARDLAMKNKALPEPFIGVGRRSATGAPVSPLQASISGAPMRSVPEPAGQPTMRPPAQAAPAAPTAPTAPASQVGAGQMDRQILADPANRAFVRTVLKEMQQSGMEPDLGYATDLLTLELAKRGTRPQMISEPTVRERLDMPPQQAAAGMDMMSLFALADQSTVADWPKIEPIAEIVIKKRPLGFLDLMDMAGNKQKVYDRLAKKKPGTPGVEFDLSGIAKRRLDAAKTRKKIRKGTRTFTRSVPRRFRKFVQMFGTKTAEGVSQYSWEVNEQSLADYLAAAKNPDKAKGFAEDVKSWVQRTNRKRLGIGTAGQQTPEESKKARERAASSKYAAAESMVTAIEKQIESHRAKRPIEPENYNPRAPSGKRYDKRLETWSKRENTLKDNLVKAKGELAGALKSLPTETVSQ